MWISKLVYTQLTKGENDMKHEMKLKEVYFEKIKKGEKIYEIRLNDEKRRMIDVGDILVFRKEPELTEELVTEVKDLIYFDSFEDMVNTLPMAKIGFGNMDKQAVRDVYYQFYSVEDEKHYGVVAIKIQVIGE